MRPRFVVVPSLAVVLAAVGLLASTPAAAAPLTRNADPVVLTGASLPTFNNTARAPIVGFRWTGTSWAQLPIQIDERAVVNFGKIYNNPSATFYGSQPGLVNQLVYTSGNTWTGNDPNTRFDSDDELVFMARDAGQSAPAGSQPIGTVAGTKVQVKVTDPLSPGAEGYVYLFKRAGNSGLVQGARVKYVKYSWHLAAGGYKLHYTMVNGSNPENTLFTGATYRHHFLDRWASDRIEVTAPGASGVDILDRHKALFSPSYCGRSEDTFDNPTPGSPNEGAFVTSKVGPVRVIRSYLGANSGPNTQRTHVFYDRREDIVTNLRVHSIPSIMDFFDYSPAASGMTYRNSVNPSGVTIDGAGDSLTAGAPTWEQVTGPQGTINQVGLLQTTGFAPTVNNYYLDDASVPITDAQCTGDGFAYRASGLFVTSAVPNTDPAIGGTASLTGTRVMYFESPGGTATDAANRRDQVLSPLATAVTTVP